MSSDRAGVTVVGDLFLSPEFLAALQASGRPKRELCAAIAASIGCGANTVALVLRPGQRVAHSHGTNTIVTGICEAIGFPVGDALTSACPLPRSTPSAPESPTRHFDRAAKDARAAIDRTRGSRRKRAATVDERFEVARAEIRAQRRRLTDEDCYSIRASALWPRDRRKERQEEANEQQDLRDHAALPNDQEEAA